MGFFYPSKILFGVPEREDTLVLKNTEGNDYELFATDEPFHNPNNQQPLYGSIPYITSLTEDHSAAVAWVNSAHTWISVDEMDEGKFVSFVSESGAMEIFAFASASTDSGLSNRVKKV